MFGDCPFYEKMEAPLLLWIMTSIIYLILTTLYSNHNDIFGNWKSVGIWTQKPDIFIQLLISVGILSVTGIGTHTAARRLGVHRCCWVIHCSRKTWLPKKGENFPRHTKLNICAFIYNKHEAIQERKFHGARRSSTSSCFEDFPYPYFSTLTQTFFPKVTFQFQKLVWIKSKLLRRHFVDRTSKGKWQTLHNKFDKKIIVIVIIKNTTWKDRWQTLHKNFYGNSLFAPVLSTPITIGPVFSQNQFNIKLQLRNHQCPIGMKPWKLSWLSSPKLFNVFRLFENK